MASRHALFRVFYATGFTPWDTHPLALALRGLVEGTDDVWPLTPGSVLDVGCGTADAAIYLAQHGWQATAVDFVPKALEKARTKALAAGVSINFVQADVTHLSRAGIGTDFQLIVDNGCFHGMSGGDRDRYVREVSAVAAPGARLLVVAFAPGGRFGGPAGVHQPEIERRFAPGWKLISATEEPRWTANRFTARFQARSYVLQRAT